MILNSFASTKGGCFISNSRLAFYLGTTDRSVRRWLEELKDAGAIETSVENNFERDIKIVAKVVIRNKEGEDTSVLGVGQRRPGGADTSVHIGNRSEGIDLDNTPPTPSQGEVLAADFEEWWKEYPKKEGKPAAKKNYIARRKEGISKDTLLSACRAYAKKCQVEQLESHRIKWPQGWLNKDEQRWTWDYTPAAPRPIANVAKLPTRDSIRNAEIRAGKIAAEEYIRKAKEQEKAFGF